MIQAALRSAGGTLARLVRASYNARVWSEGGPLLGKAGRLLFCAGAAVHAAAPVSWV
jgi:hypothetical protein